MSYAFESDSNSRRSTAFKGADPKPVSATYDGVALCRVGGLVSEEARRFDSAATTATFAAAADTSTA